MINHIINAMNYEEWFNKSGVCEPSLLVNIPNRV